MHVCGVSEAFGDGSSQVKLATSHVTFAVRDTLPGFSREDLEAAVMEAWKRWERVIGITVDKNPNPKTDATQIVTVASLDGAGGVLADQVLPYGTSVNLRMRIDSVGPWVMADNPPQGKVNLLAVITHENGHCLGLQHIAAEGDLDLMNPSYSPGIYKPQEDDISYGRKLYGPPTTVSPAPMPNMPSELQTTVEVEILGALYRAKGKFKRVA